MKCENFSITTSILVDYTGKGLGNLLKKNKTNKGLRDDAFTNMCMPGIIGLNEWTDFTTA